jgi:AcrR family transcriptional regulator
MYAATGLKPLPATAVAQPLSGAVRIDVKPTRRVASKARTRERILEAAKTQFSTHGFEGATVRAIAIEAGMSTGAVFANFDDKTDLFNAVILNDYGPLAQAMIEIDANSAAEATACERLLAMLARGYDLLLQQLPLVQAEICNSWTCGRKQQDAYRAARQPVIQALQQVLDSRIASGELKADLNAKAAVEIVWNLYVESFRAAIFDHQEKTHLLSDLQVKLSLLDSGWRRA